MPLFLTSALDTDAMASTLKKAASQINGEMIVKAAAVAAVSLIAMKAVLALLDRALRRSRLEPPVKKLLRGLLKGALWFVLVIAVLGCLDIPATSLVAVLSVMGLALSLALQNFLSNVAGGMQLLASHPFAVGDFVEAGGCSGTVAEIGMFYTKLATIDNKLVQIPNSTIVSANITNFSAHEMRRVEIKVSASYDAPTEQVIALLTRMVGEHPLTLATPEPAIHVDSYGDSAITYVVRVWCANADYWSVYFDLMDGFKPAFDAAGIEMTYPHLNVHMMKDG